MKLPLHILALTFFCFVSLCRGQGALIAGHFGNTDPINEGFLLSHFGSPSLAPVANDLGFDAWHIGLGSDASVSRYSRLLTEQEQASLEAGWHLSVTLRILEPFSVPQNGLFAKATNLGFSFGAQPDGDPVLIVGNSEYALEGAGSGYHNYQLTYDATVGLASLSVDGDLLATEITVSPFSFTYIDWGGSQHPPGTVAYANWHEVSLWAIPEPSTVALLLLGIGAAVCVRLWRR